MQRISISPPYDNPEDLFWAGIHEHRDRRLAHLHRRQQQQQDATVTTSENRDALTQSSVVAPTYYVNLPAYHCKSLMYTGTIAMGTPSQFFNVKLDTATSVSWLPSVRCDQTCHYSHFTHYDPSASTTYGNIDPSLSSKFLEIYKYDYWASLGGTFIKDTLHLGNNVSVSDYIFAEVTNYDYEAKCEGEGGRLGLGLSKEPPTESIWNRMVLKNRMFSIYLNLADDYLNEGNYPDTYDGSEIVFGGVDSGHYKGCIQWHPPSNIYGSENTWNTGLLSATVGQDENDATFSPSTIDINGFVTFDTSKLGIIGHPDIILQLTSALGLVCYDYGLDEEGLFPIGCGDGNGYDVAVIGCEKRLRPIEFNLVDGTKYRLDHEDLVRVVEVELIGPMCFVSIASDIDSEQNVFTFGAAFFNHYYVAFNVDTRSIGLAEAIGPKADNTHERCDADYPFDIAYYENEIIVVPGNDNIIQETTETTPSINIIDESTVTTAPKIINDPAVITPAVSKASKVVGNMKVWADKNPTIIVAATVGSVVSILMLVLAILTCRSMYRHRKYKRADINDEIDTTESSETSKPGIAEESELPGLI